jgi:hypothetical protein
MIRQSMAKKMEPSRALVITVVAIELRALGSAPEETSFVNGSKKENSLSPSDDTGHGKQTTIL